jgi:hypothetical protein
MMYATETVLALHRARTADERRVRTDLARRQEERTTREPARRVNLRPAPAR